MRRKTFPQHVCNHVAHREQREIPGFRAALRLPGMTSWSHVGIISPPLSLLTPLFPFLPQGRHETRPMYVPSCLIGRAQGPPLLPSPRRRKEVRRKTFPQHVCNHVVHREQREIPGFQVALRLPGMTSCLRAVREPPLLLTLHSSLLTPHFSLPHFLTSSSSPGSAWYCPRSCKDPWDKDKRAGVPTGRGHGENWKSCKGGFP